MTTVGGIHPMMSSNPFAQAQTAQASATGATSDTANAPASNQLTGNSFIQLLTAQLKAQDPLNPVDPTTFVSQLVQFNQLEQLIQINSTLSGAASAGSTPASGTQAQTNSAAATH